MRVKIYLRFIVKDKINYLALFDSNGHVGINDLITDALPGATIIWKLDRCSGIKSITRIYSKAEKHPVFKSEPEKRSLCRGFKLQLEKEVEGEEKYTIECILCDNTPLKIDPVIRVPPPPPIPGN
jgi:hypothetical protein